jgi:hypothetical protein
MKAPVPVNEEEGLTVPLFVNVPPGPTKIVKALSVPPFVSVTPFRVSVDTPENVTPGAIVRFPAMARIPDRVFVPVPLNVRLL